MHQLVTFCDGFSKLIQIFRGLRVEHGKEKSQDCAYWNLAYYEKRIHFLVWSWEKKKTTNPQTKPVHVDLLYYDNLKTVNDIVLTQELQTFPLLGCSIRG